MLVNCVFVSMHVCIVILVLNSEVYGWFNELLQIESANIALVIMPTECKED